MLFPTISSVLFFLLNSRRLQTPFTSFEFRLYDKKVDTEFGEIYFIYKAVSYPYNLKLQQLPIYT